MSKKVNQMIEDQVRFWLKQSSSRSGRLVQGSQKPVITISREFGAGGAALAEVLSEKMGYKVWDRDLLRIISEELGTSEDFARGLDEARRGMLEDTIFGIIHQRETNLHYLIYLVKTVRALERYGANIIVGRGGNYICQKPESFHVRVVCPLKKRIAQIAHKEEISHDKANEKVLKKDMERANFIRHNFNRDIDNAADYDLVLNSNVFSMENMADLVIKAYEHKTGIRFTPKQKPALH